jgi:hypothetical protein
MLLGGAVPLLCSMALRAQLDTQPRKCYSFVQGVLRMVANHPFRCQMPGCEFHALAYKAENHPGVSFLGLGSHIASSTRTMINETI